ncbi:phospholipase A and acyltransferase 4-like [Pleuronectes platessa]|uniref:phospholipase A and acyltransferase 4-like n=1 Tax=Pleuronectes platessa TaxID=8262 RepID=UPI00232A5A43|nr:phospholipase A and acyltransferase 4-like [Pleuronectes platessa]
MAQTFNREPGDLIEIFRWPYKHWAVYIGEDEVVNLVNDCGQSSVSSAISSNSNGKVKREKLTDVVGNDRCQVNNLLDEKYQPRDPSIIVKEALAIDGRELQYNIVTYNSEHFATEMRYGVAVSLQMKKPSWIANVAGTAVTLVTGASGVALGVAAVGAFVTCAALIRSRSSS